MLVPLDYKDLLKVLNKHKVRYLIIERLRGYSLY